MPIVAKPLRRYALLGLVALGALTGCDEARVVTGTALEQDDSNFQEGKRLAGEGKPREALNAFEKVILTRRDASESHLEAGNLCLDANEVKDPLLAIFHFRMYIKSHPDVVNEARINQRIRSAEKEFLKTLPFRPIESNDADRVADYQDKLRVVREENDRLKRDLTAALAKGGSGAARIAVSDDDASPGFAALTPTFTPATVATPPAGPATPATPATALVSGKKRHTIVRGDNLSKIATKYYGSPARWRDIFNANRSVMRNERDLKLGVELVIPE